MAAGCFCAPTRYDPLRLRHAACATRRWAAAWPMPNSRRTAVCSPSRYHVASRSSGRRLAAGRAAGRRWCGARAAVGRWRRSTGRANLWRRCARVRPTSTMPTAERPSGGCCARRAPSASCTTLSSIASVTAATGSRAAGSRASTARASRRARPRPPCETSCGRPTRPRCAGAPSRCRQPRTSPSHPRSSAWVRVARRSSRLIDRTRARCSSRPTRAAASRSGVGRPRCRRPSAIAPRATRRCRPPSASLTTTRECSRRARATWRCCSGALPPTAGPSRRWAKATPTWRETCGHWRPTGRPRRAATRCPRRAEPSWRPPRSPRLRARLAASSRLSNPPSRRRCRPSLPRARSKLSTTS
mmetsp:Transcript_20816/g.56019  ORF Transcript_20816/g.56019 Transcript_20816/m.56019 type:complete len:358 (+) Transcript_20816:535-1608(+)